MVRDLLSEGTHRVYSMICLAPTVSAVLDLPAPARAEGTPIPEVVASLSGLSRVAVLAPDALGMYAWNLWRAEMAYLDSLHGQNSIVLRSAMPSITPVNFATMVTGADVDGHGVRAREDDFACETLFDMVRQAGGQSAGVGLSGYTGSELLGRHADIWGDAGDGSDDDVVDKVIKIAEAYRPAFLIAQLGRVDDVFHQHGPSSADVVPMLRETDARLKRLVEHLKPLRYGVIILADHGQHDVIDPAPGEFRGSHGTDRAEDRLVPCTWT
jgi:hypothetical protein